MTSNQTELSADSVNIKYLNKPNSFIGKLPNLKFDWEAPTGNTLYFEYNSNGHRTQMNIESLPDVYGVAFGCSFTEGAFLNVEEVYHQQLGIEVYNCGLGGASNEHSIYNLAHFLRLASVKPKFVIFQITEINRFLRFINGENKKVTADTIAMWNWDTLEYTTEFLNIADAMSLGEWKTKTVIETAISLCALAETQLILIDGFNQWQDRNPITPIDIINSEFHPEISIDKAIDGYHPGVISNRLLAKKIKKVLNAGLA